ncbi:MAG: hydantoinase/carbamoylase family amidase [Rhodospirillales bacterium]|nr:hydantoinase/carbamoylase family amidase [Rhodospirillales bacterium]MCB9995066.1 hydantoinase/carbamoylase family amidase [Rhodospirillales bacterium]
MPDFSTAMKTASDIYRGLEAHWNEAKGGIYRPSYSAEETQAMDLIAREAHAMGMKISMDVAGNAHMIYPGKDRTRPMLMIGSHVDAVPAGGRYDGTAGVVAGMAALKHLHESGQQPEQDVCITIFRGEESAWFGMSCMGSKFITGDLSREFLKAAKHKETGKTLAHHMDFCGLDSRDLADKLDAGKVFPLKRIGNYIEVHIEQGPALLEAQKSLGIVTAIRGHVRYPDKITFNGEAAHSGSTPQAMRKDAAIAASVFVSDWVRSMKDLADHDDLVYSVPDIHVVNPSSTTVPAQCVVQPEVRTTSQRILDYVPELTKTHFLRTINEFKLPDGELTSPVIGKPATMEISLQDALESSANRLGFSSMRLPSGAGHDAGILANAGIPCGMLFIRHGQNGISHNAEEILGLDPQDNPFRQGSDFCNAVAVLADLMTQDLNRNGRMFFKPFDFVPA